MTDGQMHTRTDKGHFYSPTAGDNKYKLPIFDALGYFMRS